MIEDTKKRPTGKAAVNYKEVYYLFDAQPSKGHVYDLMDLVAQKDGFSYDKRDEEVNRLTVDLDDVNESLLVHAANTPTEGGAA